MNKPKLSIAIPREAQAVWETSDAILDKREDQLQQIWDACTLEGLRAVQGVMDYISAIEGQNQRLNARITLLENQSITLMESMTTFLKLINQGVIHVNPPTA